MLKIRSLTFVLLALALAACSGGGMPLSSKGLQKVPAGFGHLSRCSLIDIVLTKNGVRTPSADFERVNRKMVWRFRLTDKQLQSERQGPGQPIIIKVPLVQISRNKIIAQGPTKVPIGRQQVRIEINRSLKDRKTFRVRQTRTWIMADASIALSTPWTKKVTFIDIWTLHCKA